MRHRDTIVSAATFLGLTLLATMPGVSAQEQTLPSDLATLLAMLRMQDAKMREHAATALGDLGDERARLPLTRVMLEDPEALTALRQARSDPDADVRYWAAEAIRKIEGR